MKPTQRPCLFIFTLTVPQAILFLVFWHIHAVIRVLLPPASTAAWLGFGLALAALWLGFTGYALAALIRRRPVHHLAGLAMLALYIPWLYLVFMNLATIIPPDIPRWMLSWAVPEAFLLTLTIPALAHAMTLLVAAYTPERGRYKPWLDAVAAVGVPAVWYLLANTGLAWLRFGPEASAIAQHALAIFFVLCTAVFLFAVARLLYALLRERGGWLQKASIPFLVVMPVAGLALNQKMQGIFGDFSHPLFYVLAIITAVLLVLPMPERHPYRFSLYAARCVVFPFTAYFFLVFLPFLPLAIPAILLAGAGFLMLTPLMQGIKHVLVLRRDFADLRPVVGTPVLIASFFLGCALLPGSLYLAIWSDGAQIQRALNHLYRTEYARAAPVRVSQAGLSRALKNMTVHRTRTRGRGLRLGSGEEIPYLTSLYDRLVLDNLTLSQDRRQTLARVFLDREEAAGADLDGPARTAPWDDEAVVVKSVKTSTTAERKGGSLRSRIDLELQNVANWDGQEFVTVFELPAGCYITGYYLVVGGRRKQGMLVDKRAATWVYRQVLNARKDPGILVYGAGGKVTLRVFPFAKGETRYTGLELVHAAPVTLDIGGREARLGGAAVRAPAVRTVRGAVFIPAAVKHDLPRHRRNPAYHFILDFSAAARGKTDAYAARVEAFLRSRGLGPAEADITAANYNLTTVSPGGDWRQKLGRVRAEGGFHLDRAVKAFLYEHYRTASGRRPVIVAVTDDPEHWRLYEDYTLWRPAFPESDAYYRLGDDGGLYRLSLLDGGDEWGEPADLPPPVDVLAWPRWGEPRAYLPEDGQDGIVLTEEAFAELPAGEEASDWETGLVLEAFGTGLSMNPAGYRARELALIRRSLQSGVMSRATSYIVLENEAQEAALRAKQRQILKSGKVVDTNEIDDVSNPEPEMVEPSVLLLAMLALLIAGVIKKSKSRISKVSTNLV
ncbi:MAG: MSEP-CTERM sorting domain-containing protein [Patescibacteria group bacterium]